MEDRFCEETNHEIGYRTTIERSKLKLYFIYQSSKFIALIGEFVLKYIYIYMYC